MKDTKQTTVMVIDNGGSYVSLALGIAPQVKTVYYCNMAWQEPYPKPNKTAIGEGFDEIVVVDNPWDVYDEIDFWIFPDCYFGSFQEWLIAQGEKVWGSRAAEELEIDRQLLKQHMVDLKLPVNQWRVIVGTTKLRKFLEDNGSVWVKIIKWRGAGETFFSKNYTLSKPCIDNIEYENGAMAENLVFICEQPINDALEIGYDGYTVNGLYPDAWLSGPEIKDKAYIGYWKKYSDLPKAVTDFNTAMVDTFKKYGYTGFISCENRIKGGKSYMIDFTARMPCPPGSLYLNMVPNLAERMWAGANGEMVGGDPAAKFGCELLMDSECAEKQCQNIYFPDSVAGSVKLKKCKRIDVGHYAIIPNPAYGTSDIGSIVGIGDTLEAAKAQVLKVADMIEGGGITIRKDALDEAQAAMDKYEKVK